MAAIYKRGYLIVGVDQSTPLLSYRDPATGRVDGFNVAIAQQVAKAIFGHQDAIKLVAITSARRRPVIEGHQVDLIADPTTINCDRLAWADFSTDYLDAHQRVLVPSASTARGIGDLGGQKVCAAAGTTSIHAIAVQPSHPVPVAVPNWSDCLALLHPATSAGAFADVEADLAAGISADRASFTAFASRGDHALGGLAAGMGIASLLMSAGCAWGLSRRIAEYR
jgi:polar amino acid transport system substrate-binding protein